MSSIDGTRNENSTILLHVKRAGDILFDTPILTSAKRVLNPAVEEFLIEEAEKLPRRNEINLLLQFEERQPSIESDIGESIHRHFTYSTQRTVLSVRTIFKLGWISLLTSIMFLILMFSIAFSITALLPDNAVMTTLRELFIILGWVALWRPADLLLYDWRSVRRRGKLLARLAQCKVSFK